MRTIESPFVYEARSDDPTGLLAQWDAGLFGLEWIEELVRQGKAKWETPPFPYGSYRYIMSAKDLLPILLEGMPYILGKMISTQGDHPFGGRLSNVTFNLQKISQCPLDREILITVWDMS
jgi:hypothetical protein